MAFSLCVLLGLLGASADYVITDTGNHRVQLCPELSPGGDCLTVAGTGVAGSALNQLNSPTSVALDANGGLHHPRHTEQQDPLMSCGEGREKNCTELFTNWMAYAGYVSTGRQQGVAVDWSGRYVLADTYDQIVSQCTGSVLCLCVGRLGGLRRQM